MPNNFAIYIESVLLFLIIFNPPIYKGLSFTVAFTIISILYCMRNINKVLSFFRNKRFSICIKLFTTFYVYYALTGLIHYSSITYDTEMVISNILQFSTSYVSLFSVSLMLMLIMKRTLNDFSEVCKVYMCAGLIQTLIGIMCLFSVPIKSYFVNMMMNNSGSEKIASSLEFTSVYRNFGFASTLYDIFGMTMSVLAIITISMGLKGTSRYYLYGAAISLVAVINARTSAVLIPACLIFILFANKNIKNVFSYRLKIILLGLFVVIGGVVLMNVSTESQLEWLMSGYEDTSSLMEGERTGVYNSILSKFIFFPSKISEILFGTGLSPAQAVHINSDMGYIQNIWNFGIIGSLLLYAFYITLFRSAWKQLIGIDSILIKTILFMVAIYMIKLTCLGYSMAALIFVPMCFYAISIPNSNNVDKQYIRRRLIS